MKLLLILCLSFMFSAFAKEKDCSDGKCIPRLLRKVRIVGEIYRAECLPKNIKVADIEEYHKVHPLTEQCWRYISEINHLDDEITKQQAILESQTACDHGDCKKVTVKPFFAGIENLLNAVPENKCTPKKMEKVRQRCPDDLKCVMASFAMGPSGYAFEKIIPKDLKPPRCHLGDDSCTTKFATSFFNSVFHFLSGLVDFGKIGAKAVINGSINFWNWITQAEDHSSTTQLALAKASEDPGIFKQLLTDFPGSMYKIFAAFFSYTDTWLREDVFCKKWSGLPHLGKCIRPLDGYECVSCKTLITGVLCSLPGYAVGELVPAFISGGLTTALKFGASGGVKLARSIKATKLATQLAKDSSLAKTAAKTAAVSASLSAKAYKLSKLRILTQSSLKALKNLSSTSKAYIASTKVGKAMVFSTKALKSSTEIILIPIDNPMTNFAYKAGARSFNTALKLGKASQIGEQPLNLSGGLLKVFSPSMRGARETEKTIEKDEEKEVAKKELKFDTSKLD